MAYAMIKIDSAQSNLVYSIDPSISKLAAEQNRVAMDPIIIWGRWIIILESIDNNYYYIDLFQCRHDGKGSK